MLDMNVCGDAQRGVSTTYATSVGNEDASSSVTMAPLALHVKISIWPGVSTMMCSSGGSRGRSSRWMTCSTRGSGSAKAPHLQESYGLDTA
jgi:hypothetical protein